MKHTTIDLDQKLGVPRKYPGSPWWNHLARSQRNRTGNIVCPLDGRIWPTHLESEMEWDHIVPKSAGGEDTLRNSQLVCPTCNGAKRDMTQDEAKRYIWKVRGMTVWERWKLYQRRYYRSERGQEVHARSRRKQLIAMQGGNATLPLL